jgi:DNA topoisomerase-1
MAKTAKGKTTGTGTTLVIVESPTKANTIRKYLGDGYEVEASVGHVRDLVERKTDLPEGDPRREQKWIKYGVNTENDFETLQEVYVVPPQKARQVALLKQALKRADQLFLATDDDREGEAISWHLAEELQPKIPVKRLVFHEITREAIAEAVAHPRELDINLVSAQRTRRVVDRLYGWDVSEVLWRKIKPGLSAGRVQSVALRLLAERERERIAFVTADWSSVHANLLKGREGFEAHLTQVAGKKLATGKDFDANTGLPRSGVLVLDAAAAQGLVERLAQAKALVQAVETKPQSLRPAPPFTTSTLQQEANRKLRWSARQTMQVAQRLYENGHITYMRTDSVTLSGQAIDAARHLIAEQYGQSYLPAKPRQYQTKVANAQEAHEAIRPAGTRFASMAEVAASVGADEAKLYDLIWKRTVASQMADAQVEQTSVDIGVADALLRASGRVTRFAGFLKAYVEGSDDPEAALSDRDDALPALSVGEVLQWGDPPLHAQHHTTQPPARLSDATLVKALEEKGIGRPSTYAAILQNLLDKVYCFRKGQALVPTFMGMAVVTMIETHMPHLVDYAFTARMEERLDRIATGEDDVSAYLRGFYSNGMDFGGHQVAGLRPMLAEVRDRIDPQQASSVTLQHPGQPPLVVRIGKYGTFVKIGERTATVPDDVAPDELTIERAEKLIEQKAKGDAPLGQDPLSGRPVYLKNGRFGWFLQLGAMDEPVEDRKNVSLSKGMEAETVNLELALRQLTLPKVLGTDAASGQPVTAHAGRYGDYVQLGEERRNMTPGRFAIDATFDEAVALLAKPKSRGGREHLRDIGQTAEGLTVSVWSGRFGPYVTDGTRNATLKVTELDKVDLARALELLAAADKARTGNVLGADPQSGQPVRLLDGRFGPYVTNGAVNASLARGTLPEEINLEMALDRLKHFGKPAKTKAKGRKAPGKAAAKAPAAKASGEAAPKAVKAAKAAAPKAKPAAKAKAKPAAKAPPPPPAPPPISARNQEVAVVPAAPAKPSVVRRRPGA